MRWHQTNDFLSFRSGLLSWTISFKFSSPWKFAAHGGMGWDALEMEGDTRKKRVFLVIKWSVFSVSLIPGLRATYAYSTVSLILCFFLDGRRQQETYVSGSHISWTIKSQSSTQAWMSIVLFHIAFLSFSLHLSLSIFLFRHQTLLQDSLSIYSKSPTSINVLCISPLFRRFLFQKGGISSSVLFYPSPCVHKSKSVSTLSCWSYFNLLQKVWSYYHWSIIA